MNNPYLWKRFKLFLGDSRAGKTSVLQWLKGKPFQKKHISTNGITVVTADMHNWTEIEIDTKEYISETFNQRPKKEACAKLPHQIQIDDSIMSQDFIYSVTKYQMENNKKLPVTFQIWDFAGQDLYYNTHHFFLNSAAIFIVIVDINKPNLERFTFWLRSVHSYAPKAPIIILNTHKDLVKTEEKVEQEIHFCFKTAQEIISDSPLSYCC